MASSKRLLGLVALALLALTGTASAHPLGNFTTNLHLGILFTPERLEVTLVVDMAEIPAFREKRVIDDGDAYLTDSCGKHLLGISLLLDGRALNLQSGGGELVFPPGEGGLDTLRLECEYSTDLVVESGELAIINDVYRDRQGWSEIVVKSEGLALDTELPSESPSVVLTLYPAGATQEVREAVVGFGPGTGSELRVGELPSAQPSLVGRLGRDVVGGSGILALLAALALGATHALAPGHGKTLMAAYLVGRRGSPATAVGLGLSVALSHTIGVAILGLITALTTSAFQPESVYPWLSLASALIVTSIGAVMLARALTARGSPPDHPHPHDHDQPHEHEHHHEVSGGGGWRSLAALGLAGGLVPSASAVVLLLGAVAQGEAWWGLVLVAGFGLGMSVSLIGAGLLAVGAQRWGWTRIRSDRWREIWQRRVPLVGGSAVTAIGLFLLWDTSRRFFA